MSIKGLIEAGDAFQETVNVIESKLCPGLVQALDKRSTVTVVQFSGVNQLESDYIPGNAGKTGIAELHHYNFELEPTAMTKSTTFDFKDTDNLDGNGQLFLAIQDLNMENFFAKLGRVVPEKSEGQKRYRFMIVISDEEWDCKHLATAPEFGSGITDAEKVN